MARRLCRCADRQGPPISAVGSPQPPPYVRTPSPEFQTPPQEFMPVVDIPLSPPLPTALPIPPPVSQSPIPFLEQENAPPACCAGSSTTEEPLVPIEVESDDAEGSGEVEESTMCQSPYFIFALFALLTSLLVKCLHSHHLYAFATSLSSFA